MSVSDIRNLKTPASWITLTLLGIITVELNLIGVNYDPGRSLYLPSFTGFLFACAYLCRPRILPVLALIHIVRHGIILWQLDFQYPWALATMFLFILIVPTLIVAWFLKNWRGYRGFEDPAILLRVFFLFLVVHLAVTLPVHYWFSRQAGGMFWVYRSILNSMSQATSILLVGRFFSVLLLGRSTDLQLARPWSLLMVLAVSIVPGLVWIQDGVPGFFNTLVLILSLPILLVLAVYFNALWVSLVLIVHGWMVTLLSARGLSPLAAGDENSTAVVTYAYLIFVVLSISIVNLLASRRDQARKALAIWKTMLTRRVERRTQSLRRELEWRREAEVLIRNLSHKDNTTEWLNRSGLREETAYRSSEANGCYVLMVLENYRKIENAEGYDMTELALKGLTERLEDHLPDGSLSARVDDIHLAFVLYDRQGAVREEGEFSSRDGQGIAPLPTFMVRLMELCDPPVPVGSSSIPFRVRAAAVPFPGGDVTASLEEAFKQCRRALESLARDQNARWTILEESAQENTTEFRLLNEVQRALENEDLILFYQPIHAEDQRSIIGCEALIRWKLDDGKILGPAAFIQTVERDELIIDVGFHCARVLARFARNLSDTGNSLQFYSLNVAARQLQLGSFADKLLEVWQGYGLAASTLKVEVTESAFAGESEAVVSNLQRLHRQGVAIALDDFGTGYSSLSYLDRFPLDTIKVDRIFVQNLDHGLSSKAVLSAIGSMANQLNLSVIVEGIEDQKTLEHVQSLIYVSGWQGYLFSPPIPDSDFIDYLSVRSEAPSRPA
ncbi:MAG: hypothetical protein CMF59_02310 [Leptospiraceae bacterium]|nr:hypothetical protein [Leptospiraceae bacterium]